MSTALTMNAITVEKLNAPNREMLGAVVRIRGLTGEQEDANGLEGVAEQFDMLKQHFHVKLDDKRMKLPGWRKGEAKVSESNLEIVEGSAAFDDPALAALVALAGVDANAPPKRAAAAASSKAKKPRSSAPPEPDWRTPLFFWRGEVSSNGTSWSGTWVASADGLPSDADFAASANTFTLSCSENISTMSDGPSGTADAPAATLTGSYKGDGQEDISDTEHSICVQEGPAMGGPMGDSGWVSVAGRGTNRFGKFLSLGKMVRTNDGEHVLTLARRYLAEKDPRCTMSAQKALGRVSGEEEGKDMWACEEPWLALPWKVPKSWPAALPVPAWMLENMDEAYMED